MSAPKLYYEEYSDKSVVMRGQTKDYKTDMKLLQGMYNAKLKGGPGWIFRNSSITELDTFIKQVENGKQPTPSPDTNYTKYPNSSYKPSSSPNNYVKFPSSSYKPSPTNIDNKQSPSNTNNESPPFNTSLSNSDIQKINHLEQTVFDLKTIVQELQLQIKVLTNSFHTTLHTPIQIKSSDDDDVVHDDDQNYPIKLKRLLSTNICHIPPIPPIQPKSSYDDDVVHDDDQNYPIKLKRLLR